MSSPSPTSYKSRDLVAIGEVMAELVRDSATTWSASPAGDVFNVLVRASRLGMRCSFISAVGDDGFRPMILDALAGSEIERRCVIGDAERQNGLYTIESDEHGERSFHYWRRGSAAAGMLRLFDANAIFEEIEEHRFLFVSGVTLAVIEERELLVEIIKRMCDRTIVVLDTNYRPALWESASEYRFWWERLLPYSSLLLPSWDDVAAVYGADHVEETLLDWSREDRVVVVKRGAEGCGWVEGERLVVVPPLIPERIVDTAGAGDAFNAGVLASLARGESLEAACALGQKMAIEALAVRGALGGWEGESRE